MRRRQRGQVLPLVVIVIAILGVTLVAGGGDIAVAEHVHELADEAATLGALSGAETPARSSVYEGSPRLADDAIRSCEAAVAAVTGQPRGGAGTGHPRPCAVDSSGTEITVDIVLDVHLPVPVPFVAPRVAAHRVARMGEGTTRATTP